MYMMDYHLHTDRSLDARDSLMEVCMAAVEKGIKEIAVTDHFEPVAGNPNYSFYKPEESLKEVENAKKIFGKFIRIKFGVELGHPHLYPEHSEKLIERYPYDFVIASGHKMKGDVDFSEINYNYSDLDKFCQIYLDNLKEIALWGHYDCIGHFDLIKRYAARQKIKIDLMENYKEQIEAILKIIIEKGKGIEINTSGLRQYSKDCLPDYGIVRVYNRLGGKIITVGSDAHQAPDVGEGIGDAIVLAEKAGFNKITGYHKRVPYFINIHGQSQKESA